MDEEIIKRIVLTPAERMVLMEQAENAKVAFEALRATIEAGDVKGLVLAWLEVTQPYEYMSNILSAKTNRALHSLMRERGGEM